MRFSKEKLHLLIFLVTGILLLAYSTIRALRIPMTVDEATTFLVYVQLPLENVFWNEPVNTNNHFLNTFLIKLSTWILGDSDFSVRLPSLVGHLFYIIFSFKLLSAISQRTLVILCGIALLHFNPYFVDFFGLARGYSLSWGMMMASMYYLYRYIQSDENKYIHSSFIFAGFSVYSILIGLNYFVGLIVAFNFVFIKNYFTNLKSKEIKNQISFVIYFFQKNLATIYTSVILFSILAYPISKAKANNEFYGEWGSFFKNTMLSVTNQSLFNQKYFGTDFPLVLIGLAIAVYLSVIFYASLRLLKKRNEPLSIFDNLSAEQAGNIFTGGLAFAILLTIVCWSTIAQFYLLGIPFLADRTALILVPLFGILPVFFFSFFEKRKWLQSVMVSIPLLALSFHFSKTANLYTVREWWFDTNTKDAIIYFLENEKLDKEVTTLAMSGWNSPSFHFYEKIWNLDQVDMVRKDKLEKGELFDYYYIEEGWTAQISIEQYEVVQKFDTRVLLRLKK